MKRERLNPIPEAPAGAEGRSLEKRVARRRRTPNVEGSGDLTQDDTTSQANSRASAEHPPDATAGDSGSHTNQPSGATSSNATNDLRDRLVRIPPRERAGPRASNRLEYQRHWALVELLARHERGEDYCVIFEHHDDVLFLDSADAPTGIEFYQIKTYDRDWTINALVARPGGTDGSADGTSLTSAVSAGSATTRRGKRQGKTHR